MHDFHYQHHVEAVWIVEGAGTLTDLETGEVHPLAPGTMYLLTRVMSWATGSPVMSSCACCVCSTRPSRERRSTTSLGAYPAPQEVA